LLNLLTKASKLKPPKYELTVNGKKYLLTQQEYDKLVTKTIQKLQPGMDALKNSMTFTRGLWNDHKSLNNDQYIVAWCIEAYARVELPKEGLIKAGEKGVEAAEKALKSRNLNAFKNIFPKATTQVNTSRVAMKKYISAIHDGGNTIVTGLEYIKGGSFMIVGVIAAPVAASTFGVGAIAAGVIAGAGTAAVETLADEVGKGVASMSQGGEAAIKNVLRDAVIGGAIGAFTKGKYAEKMLKKIVPAIAKKLPSTLAKKMSKSGSETFIRN